MQRPLLLLDVDGVLCPLGDRGGEELIPIRLEDGIYRYSVHAPERLRRLGEVFRLVWATSWEDDANELLGPVLGLPPLPVIHFDDDVPLGTSYKLPAIQRYVGDRAAAYADDDIGNDAHRWAESRPFPTLLLTIPADRGLGNAHVEQLLAFAAGLDA